ncbi:MAG: hypothetical protein OXU61_12545 [Gammaproteobacteria bacterium]|nr:hypothetical protein [Gammaproteobacteria bacterium]
MIAECERNRRRARRLGGEQRRVCRVRRARPAVLRLVSRRRGSRRDGVRHPGQRVAV